MESGEVIHFNIFMLHNWGGGGKMKRKVRVVQLGPWLKPLPRTKQLREYAGSGVGTGCEAVGPIRSHSQGYHHHLQVTTFTPPAPQQPAQTPRWQQVQQFGAELLTAWGFKWGKNAFTYVEIRLFKKPVHINSSKLVIGKKVKAQNEWGLYDLFRLEFTGASSLVAWREEIV